MPIPHFPPRRWLVRAALVLAVAAVPAHSAWALVKCVGSDGRVTFQDRSCELGATSVDARKRFGQEGHDAPTPRAPTRAKTESPVHATATTTGRPAFGGTGTLR